MTAAGPRPRRTAQKAAVWRALEQHDGFISPQDLHQRLEEAGISVGIATVYRHLNALAESGDADTIPVSGGQLFRACEPHSHHHHLVCEICGTAVDIDAPDEGWFLAIAQAHGFTVNRHILEIFGRCPQCHAAGAPDVKDSPSRVMP